ncbi:MAG: hypothetical protein COT73_12655 [Bdellovibrio sp. CG10_big_fil_rev_8_21_14_0_10_47_8]|nr:MAG: hypothetical protein COT73_12655 [Bdellovibrio sp. CG10_big_fil_rev_8_21_14_0_10_47_8]
MQKSLLIWALTAALPAVVWAQGSLDEEVNAELDRMYQAQVAGSNVDSNQGAGGHTQVTQVTVQPQQVSSPQIAVTQLPVQNLAVQKQPTTVIEASPLTESKAERMRKSRQDAELQTEQTIVEKLEQSRLEDEKKRSEILFGDKFNSMMNQGQAQQQPVPPPQAIIPVVVPEQQVAVAPIHSEEKVDREAIRGEINAALSDLKKEQEPPKSTSYLAALVGAGDYPDARNVKGQYALGVAFGKKFNDRLVVEGSFMYSNYQVEQRDGGCYYDAYGGYQCYPRITEMNQYGTAGLVKYQLLGGVFRPEIGTLVSYTYRTFADTQFALSDEKVSSQALDMGVMGGVSLEMAESFAIGLDLRYMWNLTNKVDNGFQRSYVQPYLKTGKPIEELSYYTVSIVGKASF